MSKVFTKHLICVVMAAAGCFSAASSQAQAQVIDSRPAQAVATNSGVANINSQMFGRMQQLEQEVLELRGLVEQQAFEIKRLKQQRLDDYTDLDQRISSLIGQGGVSSSRTASPQASSSVAASSATGSSASAKSNVSERGLYSDALKLLLQEKDFDGAQSKLSQYLQQFPNGLFAPNAYYWLGQINLNKKQLPESQQWFSRLLKEYPGHNKAPDAKFKLGKLYFELGDTGNAKTILSEVATSGTPAAQMAKDFMAAKGLL